MPRLSMSGLSILFALGLALWEWVFFFHPDMPVGQFFSSRMGLELAWIIFIYLSFQLVSIPFAMEASRARFIGVLDGMASLVPLGMTLVVIFGTFALQLPTFSVAMQSTSR
jgi:hypothetical protein